MRKILIVLLTLAIILAVPISTFALSIGAPYSFSSVRLNSVFEYKLSEIDPYHSLTISSIKSATDFLDNPYKIIECSPSGYMIYDETNGIFTEYSKSSPSPYLNRFGSLYYCGPTFYYHLDVKTNNLVNPIDTSESIPYYEIEAYSDSCQEYANLYSTMRNETVLNYVENSTAGISFAQLINARGTYSTNSVKTSEVLYPNFFRNMPEYFGYKSGGYCGYIALNMIIAYQDKYYNDNVMQNSFWKNYGNSDFATSPQLKNGNESFTHYIFTNFPTDNILVNGGGSFSSVIAGVSEDYYNSINQPLSHSSKIWGTFTKYTIMNELDADNPVILFGDISHADRTNSLFHGVVLYRYTHEGGFWNDPVYTVHFGHTNYSEVVLTGILGSIYTIHMN